MLSSKTQAEMDEIHFHYCIIIGNNDSCSEGAEQIFRKNLWPEMQYNGKIIML